MIETNYRAVQQTIEQALSPRVPKSRTEGPGPGPSVLANAVIDALELDGYAIVPRCQLGRDASRRGGLMTSSPVGRGE